MTLFFIEYSGAQNLFWFDGQHPAFPVDLVQTRPQVQDYLVLLAHYAIFRTQCIQHSAKTDQVIAPKNGMLTNVS